MEPGGMKRRACVSTAESRPSKFASVAAVIPGARCGFEVVFRCLPGLFRLRLFLLTGTSCLPSHADLNNRFYRALIRAGNQQERSEKHKCKLRHHLSPTSQGYSNPL